ncbi:MAG: T9SS type A sorting domain-containing protein [Bacteroidales bacterium]|nr:T9SS type A sorting domain-containing protein [Bacteroidales bacterium]
MNSKSFLIIIVFLLLGIAGYSQVINLDATTTGSTITTCSATIYDSGGPDGNYSASENYTITFYSDNGGAIIIDVLSFRTESLSNDYVVLYDGANTSDNQIAKLGGEMPEQTEYETTGNCVTIQWHSDGSIQMAGFELGIRCRFPCQDYTVRITLDAQYDATNNVYNGCIGSMVSAQIDFSNNNVNYEQTIDNTSFVWRVIKNNELTAYSGLGLNELSEPLVSGAYYIMLATLDVNGCRQNDEIKTYISLPPSFNVTSVSSPICSGTDIELHGAVVPPDAWMENSSTASDEQHCFDDESEGVEQTNCFYLTDFSVGNTITSVSDIESIGMNMEHSYMGDLDVMLQCPNGQRVTLFHRTCGGDYFGEPVDFDSNGRSCNDGPQWVGVGYDYYWTEGESNGRMSDNCPGGSSVSLPSGYYQPEESFNNLIGCPLNGEWCVIFIDYLGQDDGVLFHTEINFADYLTHEAVLFQNTYGNEMWWDGDGVQTAGFATDNTATPTIPGLSAYTFHATDNFGCTYDTTLYVTVNESPYANIAEDDYGFCGYLGQLYVDFNGIGEGHWETNAPAGLVSIDDVFSPTINISTTELNSGNAEHPYYEFYWTAQTDQLCTDSDSVRVRFVGMPTANLNINIDDSIVCGNTFEHLQAEEPEETYLGVWYDENTSTMFGDNNELAGSPSSSATVEDYGRHDFYWIVYNEFVTDPNACRDTAGPLTINFIESPTAHISEGNNVTFCGMDGELHADFDGVGEGRWSTDTSSTGIFIDNRTSPNITIYQTIFGDNEYHELYWNVHNTEFCTDTDTVRVLFAPVPSDSIVVIPPECYGMTAILTAYEDSLARYDWDFGEGLIDSITYNSARGEYRVFIHWNNWETTHLVGLTATNYWGCQSNRGLAIVEEQSIIEIDTVVDNYFQYNGHTFYATGVYHFVIESEDENCPEIIILNLNVRNEVLDFNIDGVNIYPNPVGDIVHIVSPIPISSIEILSVEGRSLGIVDTNSCDVEYDLSGFETGTYFVRLCDVEGNIRHKKIVKE